MATVPYSSIVDLYLWLHLKSLDMKLGHIALFQDITKTCDGAHGQRRTDGTEFWER